MTKPDFVPFWRLANGADLDIACTDGFGYSMNYAELRRSVSEIADEFSLLGPRQLAFIRCVNSPEWLVVYLGALSAGHVPLLLPGDASDELLSPLIQLYRPRWLWHDVDVEDTVRSDVAQVIQRAMKGFRETSNPPQPNLHPDLGCLLSTSGSTGSPKLVRLSHAALHANAESIAMYLDLNPSERALTTLPTSYSYGLSVVNSHLQAGAALVCRAVSPITREFVETISNESVTSLAGVPSWYHMLVRTGFEKAATPTVRTLTQAGGRLDERTKRAVLAMAERKGMQFFVMYGQTEATARISYVPPEMLAGHLDSIGVPIPGGRITLDPITSEIVYHGRNVMMGYAECADDLAKPDECVGELRTGDIGAADDAGFFRVTGRLKRFIKLSGNRVGLDEVESTLIHSLDAAVAVTGRDERLGVFIEGSDESLADGARSLLAKTYGLHHSLFRIELIDNLPLLPTGKRDYGELLKRLG